MEKRHLASDILTTCCIVICAFCLNKLRTIEYDFESTLKDMNISSNSRMEDQVVIFNRVPKVGSQTITTLITELWNVNNFSAFTHIKNMPTESGSTMEEVYFPRYQFREHTVNALVDHYHMKPFIFLRHQNYFKFSEYGYEKQPIYMNFVRHPIERVISWHYYIRNPIYFLEQFNKTGKFLEDSDLKHHRTLKLSLEDCHEQRIAGCVFDEYSSIHGAKSKLPSHVSQMTFFCGHDKVCDIFNSPAMLNQAIENVEKHFAVVGVLEEMEKSLFVLEKFLPRFFSNALQTYKEKSQESKFVNKNNFKPKTSEIFKNEISHNFSREIEFYHFCKQRLHKQYLALQFPSSL